jgi:hypothetical protein
MSTLFCCGSTKPYRPQVLQHEAKFRQFLSWAQFPKEASKQDPADADGPAPTAHDLAALNVSFVVQLVRQVNFGPLESKRYFARVEGQAEDFVEVEEGDLVKANFQKLNA